MPLLSFEDIIGNNHKSVTDPVEALLARCGFTEGQKVHAGTSIYFKPKLDPKKMQALDARIHELAEAFLKDIQASAKDILGADCVTADDLDAIRNAAFASAAAVIGVELPSEDPSTTDEDDEDGFEALLRKRFG